MTRCALVALVLALAAVGCGGGGGSSSDAGAREDAGSNDAGSPTDAGTRDDAEAPCDCDDDNPCTEDSCTAGACAHEPIEVECRAAAGPCDVAERCVEGACPDDALAAAGTECRGATSACDAPEACSGDSVECAADDPSVMRDCDDRDVCTDDACDTATGCTVAPTPAYGRALVSGAPEGATTTQAIPRSSGTLAGISYDLCPTGSNPGASPPLCVLEVQGALSMLEVTRDDGTVFELSGAVATRAQRIRIDYATPPLPSTTTTAIVGGTCGGALPYASVPTTVRVQTSTWPDLAVEVQVDESAVAGAVALCGSSPGSISGALSAVVTQSYVQALHARLQRSIERELCMLAELGPCPAGSSDVEGICRSDVMPGTCVARGDRSPVHLVANACVAE